MVIEIILSISIIVL